MSKAERLIEMMITINAKRDFTVGELAKEFSVSKRTILRDLQELEQAGFPLYAEVGAAGGYHILKERILPPIAFSESEAKAIFFACQALQYYRDLPFEQETISVLKKFLNCSPPPYPCPRAEWHHADPEQSGVLDSGQALRFAAAEGDVPCGREPPCRHHTVFVHTF